jgi:hypothetical protein
MTDRQDTSYLISDDLASSETQSEQLLDEMVTIGSLVTMSLLTLRNQIKIYHWQTTSYAKHKALDKLFVILNSQNDRWVETFMGKYGRISLENINNNIKLHNINDKLPVTQYLKQWVVQMRSIRDRHFDTSKDSDLSNIFDEIFGDINKTCYLLSLQ